MSLAERAPGSYPRYPEVTWDLAQERWQNRRTQPYMAICETCDWQQVGFELRSRLRRIVSPMDHRIVTCLPMQRCSDGALERLPYPDDPLHRARAESILTELAKWSTVLINGKFSTRGRGR